MTEIIKCHIRKVHVLELLKMHGPLSFRVILTMLDPPMKGPRPVFGGNSPEGFQEVGAG
jgi:hypothetical protein